MSEQRLHYSDLREDLARKHVGSIPVTQFLDLIPNTIRQASTIFRVCIMDKVHRLR
jgi:hypothetical protein